MPDSPKTPSKREMMKRAIAEASQKASKEVNEKMKYASERVAAAASVPPKPKKKRYNPRSSVARDARMKKRGRLPTGTYLIGLWTGELFEGSLSLMTVPPGINSKSDIVNDREYEEATVPKLIKIWTHKADGVFRLLEELDIMFWEWFAKPGEEELKAQLVFNPNPPKPEPMPKEMKS